MNRTRVSLWLVQCRTLAFALAAWFSHDTCSLTYVGTHPNQARHALCILRSFPGPDQSRVAAPCTLIFPALDRRNHLRQPSWRGHRCALHSACNFCMPNGVRSLMCHKDRPRDRVFQDMACRPAKQHLPQAAMRIGPHHQETGIMLRRLREQCGAHRTQMRGDHPCIFPDGETRR
jgi:hypothetical protein